MATAAVARSIKTTSLQSKPDNVFFTSMCLLLLAVTVIGFAQTYFLAGVFAAPLPNVLIHIHGAAFSCWIFLLIAQATLITAGQARIHRNLGLAGFALACAMVTLGLLAGADSLSRGFSPPGSGMDPRTFFVVPVSDMLVFSTLVFFAFKKRFEPDAHKRLILLSTIALMDAPTGRPPFAVITNHPFMDSVFTWAFLLIVVGYDLWSKKKIHPVVKWAVPAIVLIQVARIPTGGTAAFHSLADFVLKLKGN